MVTTSGPPAGTSAHRAGGPYTLAVDVGGTGVKATVLDAVGDPVGVDLREATPYPCPPAVLTDAVAHLAAMLPPYDRCSVGFPGVVRDGFVVTAPHFVREQGPGSPVVPALDEAWRRFDLAGTLTTRLRRPTRVLNDADLQGLAVVAGQGVELVVTLGTGFGTALFNQGRLCPHLEMAHHPYRDNQTYNEYLGDRARKAVGDEAWVARVLDALPVLRATFSFDRLYLGGGNSRLLTMALPADVRVVPNQAGMLGGVRLWDGTLSVF